jgi:hypothetical protein
MQVLRVGTARLSRLFRSRATWLCLMASLLAAAVAGAGLFSGHAQSAAQVPGSDSVASQTQVAGQPVLPPTANVAPASPSEQIAQLLQMANDLKVEVDKSNKDELSVTVIRKASALEQLAHKVRTTWPVSSH